MSSVKWQPFCLLLKVSAVHPPWYTAGSTRPMIIDNLTFDGFPRLETATMKRYFIICHEDYDPDEESSNIGLYL